MNNVRRKQLEELVDKLEEIKEELEIIMEEEEEYRENMPENLWESEKFEISEQASDEMESGCFSLEEAIESVRNATE